MPAAAVKGGIDSGHACFPPRPSTEGDDSFKLNGVPIHCQGHAWGVHACGNNAHDSALQAGSSSFRVNGKGAARIGDPVACGSIVADADPSFVVGD